MSANRSEQLDGIPLRNAKADLSHRETVVTPVQKTKGGAGEVLDLARANVQMERKQLARALGISHSLTLRGLKTGEMNFQRLWDLPDEFWLALLVAIAKKRNIATVRTTIEIDSVRRLA